MFVSREAVAEYLEEQIVSGQLGPGTKLPSERQLADRFGISRPIVREALRSLVERNLVEIRPARGTYVSSVNLAEAGSRLDSLYRLSLVTPRQLVEARSMLESTAAGLAAERISAARLERARIALKGCENARDIVEQARQDFIFHHSIVRAAANPVIEVMFGSISNLTFQLMLRSLSDRELVKESLPYHRAIYEAIAAKETKRASEAMRDHLDVARRLYGSDFDDSLENIARREVAQLIPGELDLESMMVMTEENVDV